MPSASLVSLLNSLWRHESGLAGEGLVPSLTAAVPGIRSPWLLAKACSSGIPEPVALNQKAIASWPSQKQGFSSGAPPPEEFIIVTPLSILKSRAPKGYPGRLFEMAPCI